MKNNFGMHSRAALPEGLNDERTVFNAYFCTVSDKIEWSLA
jgi:hypothetical protein